MKESTRNLTPGRTSRAFRKLLSAAGLFALVAMPLGASVVPAQADPDWNYQGHDRNDRDRHDHDRDRRDRDRDRDRHDRDRRDRDRWDHDRRDRDRWDNRRDRDRWDHNRRDRDRWEDRRDNDRRGNNNTMNGVVTDKKSDQRFSMRVGGRNIDVVSSSRLPRGLDRGDRVRVSGRYDDGKFRAYDVDITDNR